MRELYDRKDGGFNKPTHAYVTLTREIIKNDDSVSLGKRTGKKKVFPPGTTLKIVMVSRFDDCGVTDDLDGVTDDLEADHGYFTRFAWDDPTIVDIRWQPTPTREWNEFLSGLIAKAAPNA